MRRLKIIANEIRKKVLLMHSASFSSHVASALSCTDILTVLYFKVLNVNKNNFKSDRRDRFILSKGHAASALYAVLAKKKIIPNEYLKTYCQNNGRLCGHSDNHGINGVEAATGSLGHGLSLANGMALAAKADKRKNRIFVLMGDGECNEGSVWEAVMFAAHFKLDNITVIIDRNHLQGLGVTELVMDIEPLKAKWESFGWSVKKINGHNFKEIECVCKYTPFLKGKPSVIIAETIKGKGVSFMQDKLEWHYKSPDSAQVEKAFQELGRHDK